MKMVRRLTALLLCVLLFVSSVPVSAAAEERIGSVDVDYTLNVRSGPGMTYGVLGVLEQGSGVAVLEVRQTADRIWGRLASGGWVCMDYVG